MQKPEVNSNKGEFPEDLGVHYPGHAVVRPQSANRHGGEVVNPYRRIRKSLTQRWLTLDPVVRELIFLASLLSAQTVFHLPRGIEALYLIPMVRATRSNGRLGGAMLAIAALVVLALYDAATMTPFSLKMLLFKTSFRIVAYIATIGLVESMLDRLAWTENLAVTDPLTGVLNRLGFANQAESKLTKSMMGRRPAILVLIDVDDFKLTNDSHGHQFGDEVLRTLVRCVQPALADANGCFGRTGGDEFQILITDSSRDEIDRALERAAARFSDQTLVQGHRSTFSFGLAESEAVGYKLSSLTEAADNEMYQRKSNRNFGRGLHWV